MRYWNSKLNNLSPWPLPLDMPKNAFALAKMAIEQITTPDRNTEIQIYDYEEENFEPEDTWIVSGMSPKQKELLNKWPAVSTGWKQSFRTLPNTVISL